MPVAMLLLDAHAHAVGDQLSLLDKSQLLRMNFFLKAAPAWLRWSLADRARVSAIQKYSQGNYLGIRDGNRS